MPVRVVDASVVAAWCFREPRASEALALLQDVDLYAPSLLAYELTSIAVRKAAAYPERLEVLGDALQTSLALPVYWIDVDHAAVFRLAMDAKLTGYDASYLYLARVLGAPLATFDRRLALAAQESGL